jgi:hypothetical protein
LHSPVSATAKVASADATDNQGGNYTMQRANENGVYQPETIEELARRGRAHATIELCHCEDGLYRYALDMAYGQGGFTGPIFAKAKGFETFNAAKEAATEEMLRHFPKAWASDPASVHDELRELRTMIEARCHQPSLF